MKSKIEEVIYSADSLAIILRLEEPVHLNYYIYGGDREEGIEEKSEAQMQDFRNSFEERLLLVSKHLGEPSNIERECFGAAPPWVPWGIYADWMVSDDRLICLFIGGDGNPEDDLMLIIGSTHPSAKESSNDPWGWDWQLRE